jgi:hypothetical protein
MGPFRKFDSVHEISVWQFTSNKSCKYHFLGAMGFIWDVPTDLDPLPTYRLRFTISSDTAEEILAGLSAYRLTAAILCIEGLLRRLTWVNG